MRRFQLVQLPPHSLHNLRRNIAFAYYRKLVLSRIFFNPRRNTCQICNDSLYLSRRHRRPRSAPVYNLIPPLRKRQLFTRWNPIPFFPERQRPGRRLRHHLLCKLLRPLLHSFNALACLLQKPQKHISVAVYRREPAENFPRFLAF